MLGPLMKRVKNITLGIMTELLYAMAIIVGGFIISAVFYLIF